MNTQFKAAKIKRPVQESEQELVDYLIWSMKHQQDPHDLYDDPIEAFREEAQQKVA